MLVETTSWYGTRVDCASTTPVHGEDELFIQGGRPFESLVDVACDTRLTHSVERYCQTALSVGPLQRSLRLGFVVFLRLR